MSDASDGERATSDARPAPGRESSTRLFDRVRALFGLSPASVRDDIEDALEEAGAGGDFTPQERAILKNVLNLHEVRVADVMVPRADIVAIAEDTPLRDVLALFRTAGHSRLPVYGETLDDPKGMIHIRDLVDFLLTDPRFGLVEGAAEAGAAPTTIAKPDLAMPLVAAQILRPVLFAPPSMPALDLLVKMQASRTHMALVIDEYGGTDGIVSIEDVVESIVGDIEDEHDEAEPPEIQSALDGSILAEARAPLADVSKALAFDFKTLEDVGDVDTIGGLIATLAGRVPSRGEIISGPGGFEFEVLDADPRRVKRVKIRRLDGASKPAPAKEGEAEG